MIWGDSDEYLSDFFTYASQVPYSHFLLWDSHIKSQWLLGLTKLLWKFCNGCNNFMVGQALYSPSESWVDCVLIGICVLIMLNTVLTLELYYILIHNTGQGLYYSQPSFYRQHRGVQLILAYSWAKPAILVVGKGRGGMFLFLLFLHFHSCSSFFPVPLFHLLYSLFYLFSPFLWETTQNDPQGLTCR